MQAPNISSSSTAKIESISVTFEQVDFIDIEVEDQHTFWISDNDVDWTLTHNSGAPDIDCVHEDHLVVLSDGSYKRIGDVEAGDVVLGGDGQPHLITAKFARHLRPDETPLSFLVESGDHVLGHINVVPRHKFVKSDGTVVYADELVVGDELMATQPVIIKSVTGTLPPSTCMYVDITVEDDHRFHIVPFNVTVSPKGNAVTLTYGYDDN